MATQPTGFLGGLNTVFNTIGNAAAAASPFLQLGAGLQSAGAQKASGIYQAGLYELQAIDTLALADIRATQTERTATIQAGRKLLQAKLEARNYQIQGNQILRNLRATNAAIRARAAANGISIGSGSAYDAQRRNQEDAFFDLSISDFNALTARVYGFEDAASMYLQGIRQGLYDKYAAETQARELRTAGKFTKKSGGLIANAQLVQTGANFLSKGRATIDPIYRAAEQLKEDLT